MLNKAEVFSGVQQLAEVIPKMPSYLGELPTIKAAVEKVQELSSFLLKTFHTRDVEIF
jgi:hypothetical protein